MSDSVHPPAPAAPGGRSLPLAPAVGERTSTPEEGLAVGAESVPVRVAGDAADVAQ